MVVNVEDRKDRDRSPLRGERTLDEVEDLEEDLFTGPRREVEPTADDELSR